MYYEIALDLPKAGFDFYAGGGFLKPTTTADKKEAPSIFPIFEEGSLPNSGRAASDFFATQGMTDTTMKFRRSMA